MGPAAVLTSFYAPTGVVGLNAPNAPVELLWSGARGQGQLFACRRGETYHGPELNLCNNTVCRLHNASVFADARPTALSECLQLCSRAPACQAVVTTGSGCTPYSSKSVQRQAFDKDFLKGEPNHPQHDTRPVGCMVQMTQPLARWSMEPEGPRLYRPQSTVQGERGTGRTTTRLLSSSTFECHASGSVAGGGVLGGSEGTSLTACKRLCYRTPGCGALVYRFTPSYHAAPCLCPRPTI